jgi:hypothetical protein
MKTKEEEGYNAYINFQNGNPYKKGTSSYYSWNKGYKKAQSETFWFWY